MALSLRSTAHLAAMMGMITVTSHLVSAQMSGTDTYRCATLPNDTTGIRACHNALRTDTTDTYSAFNLGMRLHQLFSDDSIATSVQLWERTVRLRPDYLNAHYMLAQSYMIQNRRLEAIAEIHKVLAIDPNVPVLQEMLIAAEGKTDRAGRPLQPGQTVDSLEIMARMLEWQGKWLGRTRKNDTAALKHYYAAVPLLPANDGRIYVYIAESLLHLRRLDAALAAIDTAIRRDSTLMDAYNTKSSILRERGDPDAAVDILYVARRFAPKDDPLWWPKRTKRDSVARIDTMPHHPATSGARVQ